MNHLLKNLKILVTRPVHQAQTLCDAIQALGGTPILLPTIVITDVEDKQVIKTTLQELANFDIAIFISANAVEKTLSFINSHWPATTQIAVVGTSTAKALSQYNLSVTLCPEKDFNSEGLLALPELQKIAKKRVVIFKGKGGREVLATILRERGATVREVDVYKRVMPTSLITLPKQVDVIICTSNTGLQNLYNMMDKHDLLQQQLLVISQRMLVLAQSLGFVKVPWVADNATDAAIINTLIQFAEEKYDGTNRSR